MRTKKHFIVLLMLALASFAAHADAKTDALIKASANNNIAKAKRLIASGADVNSRNKNGSTALMYADSTDMAELLLAASADVNAKNEDGFTALMRATEVNSADIARLLIAAGADIEAKDNSGWTALRWAAYFDSPDVAKLLLAAHADVKTDALIKASANSNIAKVKRLIASGADVNSRNKNGSTALMYAGSPDMAEILLAASADVNAKNDEGKTALMIATEERAVHVKELIKAAGAQ